MFGTSIAIGLVMMDMNAVGWSLAIIAVTHLWLLCRAIMAWQNKRALAAYLAASAQRGKAFRGFVARHRDERIASLPDLNPEAFLASEESLCRSVRTLLDSN